MSSREFWAAEAAKMRDTSALFDMSHLAPDTSDNKNTSEKLLGNKYGAKSTIEVYYANDTKAEKDAKEQIPNLIKSHLKGEETLDNVLKKLYTFSELGVDVFDLLEKCFRDSTDYEENLSLKKDYDIQNGPSPFKVGHPMRRGTKMHMIF